jgi:hypothetical protein
MKTVNPGTGMAMILEYLSESAILILITLGSERVKGASFEIELLIKNYRG